ncbi:hypothetical protein [Komagataeibacter europaeus]|nr:hypothetical protein [Komagataeibacter europaeus]
MAGDSSFFMGMRQIPVKIISDNRTGRYGIQGMGSTEIAKPMGDG